MGLPSVQRTYHSNGQLRHEQFFQNGKLHGHCRSWNERGQLIYEAHFDEAKPQGVVRHWHDNGVLKHEATFVDGMEDGTTRSWDADGNPIESYTMVRGTGKKTQARGWLGSTVESSWRNEQLHGPLVCKSADGKKVISRQYFFNGRRCSRKRFEELSAMEAQGVAEPVFFEDREAIEKLAKKICRKRPVSKAQREQAAVADRWCMDLLSSPDAAEARTWLSASSGTSRIIGDCRSSDESRALIEAIYADGAERVTVMKIVQDFESEMSDHLVVTLPEAPILRAKLLARVSIWATRRGFDAIKDRGQRYEYAWFS
ncbi:MAG: hypothetical protein K2Y21_00750 [Phycisphaerales bacterium]|nr:hypothetical protein [Phycisphaerales bacterium]